MGKRDEKYSWGGGLGRGRLVVRGGKVGRGWGWVGGGVQGLLRDQL